MIERGLATRLHMPRLSRRSR